jgi:hypothetical protein
MIYDVESFDLCTRQVCEEPDDGGSSATSATSGRVTIGPATGGPATTGSGGRGGAAGAGGSAGGIDSGLTDSSRTTGAGGTGGGSGSGSGGASGAGSSEPPPDAPRDATGTMDAGPDPTAQCPSSLSFTGVNATTEHGMPQNGPTSTDVCPDGQILVGYRLSATTPSNFNTALVSRIEPSCGTLSIAPDQVGCKFVVSAGARLPTRGQFSNGSVAQNCPPNQVIVAFKGRSGRDTDQLGFGCAPLEITKVNTSFRTTVGAVTFLGTVGGTGGSFFQDGCPSNQVAIGNKITDENGFIGAFGLVCASITLAP